MRKPEAVIFDVDGTLLDTERIHLEAWREIAGRHGFVVPEELLLESRGITRREALALFKGRLGEDFPYEETLAERHELDEALIRERSPLCMPGARELLGWLKARGIPLAVASSTRLDATTDHLRWSGIAEFFAAAVCGDMVRQGKPAPDIFLKAAEMLGVPAERCLVVEDTPHGALAARRAGMAYILVPDLVPPDGESLAYCLSCAESLTAVREFFAAQNWDIEK